MEKKNQTKQIALSGLCIALAFVLPFLTGQIPEIGSMLCPMHIPVLLCGYLCGGSYGLIVGFISPLLRSFIMGRPLFISAVGMAFELAAYGFVSGFLYKKLPKKKSSIYISLFISMVVGRLVWGLSQCVLLGLGKVEFSLSIFLSSAIVNALPGIVLQIILVPVIVMALQRERYEKQL